MNTFNINHRHVLTLALSVALIGVMPGAEAGLFSSEPKTYIGKEDGCAYQDATLKRRIPSEETVVVIDQSEALSPTHRDQVNQLLIERMLDDAQVPVGSHVSVYVFGKGDFKPDGSGQNIAPALSMCKPAQEGNELTENVKKIQRRFQTNFLDKLTAEIDKATNTALGERSPIMEMVQFLSHVSTFSSGGEGQPKHLLLVSDLLQHSELFSSYKSAGKGKAVTPPERLSPSLEGWTVEVLVPQRYGKDQAIQSEAHQSMWMAWFQQAGAVSSDARRLP
jgi:hypothetical protein